MHTKRQMISSFLLGTDIRKCGCREIIVWRPMKQITATTLLITYRAAVIDSHGGLQRIDNKDDFHISLLIYLLSMRPVSFL